jgi:hypothetical protein
MSGLSVVMLVLGVMALILAVSWWQYLLARRQARRSRMMIVRTACDANPWAEVARREAAAREAFLVEWHRSFGTRIHIER